MNVFIVGSPLETAMAMKDDILRYNKQIIECKQMLNAIDGETKAWRNHPCTFQYERHHLWLEEYMLCLITYKEGKNNRAELHNSIAEECKPPFHTEEFFNQMKRRLFTKAPFLYSQWAGLGTSEQNYYWSPSEQKIIKYVNGKRQD